MNIKEQIEVIKRSIESKKPLILEDMKQIITDKIRNSDKDIKIEVQDNSLMIEGIQKEDLDRILKSLTQTTLK